MNARELFDAMGYFKSLWEKNKLAQTAGFRWSTCSGIETLQGALEQFRTASALMCVDDTADGATFRGQGGGYYKRRTWTVFLLKRYKLQDMASYAAAMEVCRKLFLQLLSRMIVDEDGLSNELVYLKTDNVLSRELGQYFLNGCTGLYFMVEVSEPVDISYDAEQWQSE